MLFWFTFLPGYPWLLIFPGFRRPWFPCSNCCGLQSALCDHVTCSGISSVSIYLPSVDSYISLRVCSFVQSLIQAALCYVGFKWKSYKIQMMFLTQFLVLSFVWQSMGWYIATLMSSISWYFISFSFPSLWFRIFKSLTIHRTKTCMDKILWNKSSSKKKSNAWAGTILLNDF